MKKVLVTFIVLFLSLSFVQISAQKSAFAKNDNVLGIGMGVGDRSYSRLKHSSYKRTPYFFATYERCIIKNVFDEKSSIGAGGQIGLSSITWNDYWKRRHLKISTRGAFHYAFVDKLDTYAGLAFGIDFESWNYYNKWYDSKNNNSASAVYAFFAGARYYFTDNFAGFAELGYGITVFNFGLAFKF